MTFPTNVPNPPSPIAWSITTLTTVSIQLIGANASRVGLWIINPNVAGNILIWVTPAFDVNGNPVAAVAGQCMPIYPGAGPLQVTNFGQRVTNAWNVIAASGSGNAVQAWEFLQQAHG